MRQSSLIAVAVLVFAAMPVAAAPGDITAVGPSRHAHNIYGPDAQGRYTLRVRVADLDPASANGWQTMNRRVAMGTALLCDAAGAAPRYPGFYGSEQRACREETRSAARAQMINARDMAAAGHKLSFLDLSR